MDKRTEYLDLEEKLRVLMDAVGINAQILRDELQGQLDKEWKSEVWETPTEILHDYVAISKRIRNNVFDKMDTHILTIEHLADRICARRAALERNARLAVKKSVRSEATTTIFSKILDGSKTMTEEQRKEILEILQKGGSPPVTDGDGM